MNNKTRISELENEIKKNQDAYYNNEALISDAEFDALMDELKELDPDNALLTTEVGSDHTEGFKKAKHTILMGSQAKANTESEMNKFIGGIDASLCLGQFKMDGASLELNYKNGKFDSAITRGDGETGDDITENVKKMKGVTMKLTTNYTGAVRGEVLLPRSTYNAEFAGGKYKNCRAAANGIMKHLDGSDCEKLTVVCYDALNTDNTKSFETQEKLIEFLETNKFNVAPYKFFTNLTGKMAMDYLNEVWEDWDNLDFDIDGLVWKQNKIDLVDMTTNKRPKTQIALKPAKVLRVTKLIDIKWQVKNGTLTPVGIIEPVDLQGATIKKASLCNISQLEKMGIEIGHEVTICRCGMIIPKIIKDNTTGKYAEGYEF